MTTAWRCALDYVIPRYRDFKVGRYLYSTASGVFDRPGHRHACGPRRRPPSTGRYPAADGLRQSDGRSLDRSDVRASRSGSAV